MKVALIGATDFVGSALLKEALDPGHLVTAIIRHPENLDKHEGLIDSPQFTRTRIRCREYGGPSMPACDRLNTVTSLMNRP